VRSFWHLHGVKYHLGSTHFHQKFVLYHIAQVQQRETIDTFAKVETENGNILIELRHKDPCPTESQVL
jgi:hypothetical protein